MSQQRPAPPLVRKLLIVAAMAALAAAFFYFDLGRFLTLDYVKASQARFAGWYETSPLLMLGAYMAGYICMAALSLPGATIMSLAGAAVFGFWPTLVAVSFASSIGATLACFAARYVLRDWVRSRLGGVLEKIDRGMEREGAFYLFTLRLIPAFPFFAINLAMGLTAIPLRTFYWVSQIGMLAGTAVYVNAGTQLGRIESLSGILSPQLLASFALLGVFPWIAKRIVGRVRKARGVATDTHTGGTHGQP